MLIVFLLALILYINIKKQYDIIHVKFLKIIIIQKKNK